MRRHLLTVAGAVLLGAVVVFALFGPFVYWGDGMSLGAHRYAPPGTGGLLGTDELGRDVLARLMIGGRYSLGVAAFGAFLAVFVGTLSGLWTGFKPGLLDEAVGAVADLWLSLPLVALLLIMAAIDLSAFGLGFFQTDPRGQVIKLGLIFGFFDWMVTHRIVRAHTRREISLAYAEAARAAGAGPAWLLSRAILPSLWPVMWISGGYMFGRFLVAESTLSYLGMGISPPTPTWGNMLKAAQEYFISAPGLAIWPGLLLVVAALGLNLLTGGARLRDQ